MKHKLITITKDDFDIQAIRAGGKGGQKQNKTSSAIRMVHRASGAMAVARDARSQKTNLREAFSRCIHTDIFQKWLKIEICRKSGVLDEIEKRVEESMSQNLIKTEVVENERWVEVKHEN